MVAKYICVILIVLSVAQCINEAHAGWYNTIDQQSQNGEMRRQQEQNIRDFNSAAQQQQFLIDQRRQAEEMRNRFIRQQEPSNTHNYQYQYRWNR